MSRVREDDIREHMREMVALSISQEDVELLKRHSQFLLDTISRVIDEHFDEFREIMGLDEDTARDVLERLKGIPGALNLEDLGPITDLAFVSVKNEISFYAGATVLIKIIRYMRPYVEEKFPPHEAARIISALEKFGMIFVILLSDEMHRTFFDAVERATGMSRTLFKNYVKTAINAIMKEYAESR